jgi:polysaccharide export outer membrane protein
MKKHVLLFLAIASYSAAQNGAPPANQPGAVNAQTGAFQEYRIGPGDVIQVEVWKEPEASIASAVVRPDGKITMPLIKEITVAGYTSSELSELLAEKLSKYIPASDVTVVIRETRSKKVYLTGAVKRPGSVLLLAPMTILQVLTENGGLNDYAKKKKIYLLRTENGKQSKMIFDYSAVIKGEHLEQNIEVQAGDVIVVP